MTVVCVASWSISIFLISPLETFTFFIQFGHVRPSGPIPQEERIGILNLNLFSSTIAAKMDDFKHTGTYINDILIAFFRDNEPLMPDEYSNSPAQRVLHR